MALGRCPRMSTQARPTSGAPIPALYADLLDETREEAAAQGLEPLITFDDGNLSDLDIGMKPLADRGMRAIFFPCAGGSGKRAISTRARSGNSLEQGWRLAAMAGRTPTGGAPRLR